MRVVDMFSGNTLVINTPKFSGYGGSMNAKKALYILYTTELDIKSYHINSPLMFLSPAFKSCQEPNCFLHGEVHYTTDANFCDYAKEHEPVAEFCKQLNAPVLVEEL